MRYTLLLLTLLLAACGAPQAVPPAALQAETPLQGDVPDFTELAPPNTSALSPLATGGCGVAPTTTLTYNSWRAGYASSILARNFCSVTKDINALQSQRTDLQNGLNSVVAVGSIASALAGYFGGPLILIPAGATAISVLTTSNTINDYDRAINNINNLVTRCIRDPKTEGVAYLLGIKTTAPITEQFVIFTTSTGRTFNTPQGSFISRDGCVYRQ